MAKSAFAIPVLTDAGKQQAKGPRARAAANMLYDLKNLMQRAGMTEEAQTLFTRSVVRMANDGLKLDHCKKLSYLFQSLDVALIHKQVGTVIHG